jgi:hypothetical protein
LLRSTIYGILYVKSFLHEQHYLLALWYAHFHALEERAVNGLHEVSQMKPVAIEDERWGTHQREMWQLLPLRELIAIHHEWQEVEFSPVLPNVPSRKVIDTRILYKDAFLASLFLQPFLEFLLGKLRTTLKEFVVVCGFCSHMSVFTIV